MKVHRRSRFKLQSSTVFERSVRGNYDCLTSRKFFAARPDHCRTADIDLLDGFLQRYVVLTDRLLRTDRD